MVRPGTLEYIAVLDWGNAGWGDVAWRDLPTQTLPLQLNILPTLESRPASRSERMDIDSDRSNEGMSVCSPLSSPGSKDEGLSFQPLPHLGDPFTFERDTSRERRPPRLRQESLLSQRLMDLAFQGRGDDARGV